MLDGVEGGAPLPGDFRVIVCPSPPQMNDFCDLLGTPDTPVSKISSVKISSGSSDNIGPFGNPGAAHPEHGDLTQAMDKHEKAPKGFFANSW